MPIYEYRCSSCGHQQEFMQRLSDPTLTVCTKCNKPTFSKMVTAAGFQLKGSGWYATDFKSKGSAPAASKPAEADKGGEAQKGGETKKGDGEGSKASAAACGAGSCPACQ